MKRVDWLRFVVWAGLTVGACAIANALFWLAQRVALAVWPFVQAHSDRLTSALLIGLVVVLAAVVLTPEREQ